MRRYRVTHPHRVRIGGSYRGEKLIVEIIVGGPFPLGNRVDLRREMRYVDSFASHLGRSEAKRLVFCVVRCTLLLLGKVDCPSSNMRQVTLRFYLTALRTCVSAISCASTGDNRCQIVTA